MRQRSKLTGRGLAGIAATARYVIVADRDAFDERDVFRCIDAGTGKELWPLEYATSGKIKDYGNSPRATPLIDKAVVYTLGGLGDLHCVRLADGRIVWSKHLPRDFAAAVPTWGYGSSPLAVDGKLVVNPGAKAASLVALDCTSGKEVWRCHGFLRDETSLIQTIGRAARHRNAMVLMFAETVTGSMTRAIVTTRKRRRRQQEFNRQHGINAETVRQAECGVADAEAALTWQS